MTNATAELIQFARDVIRIAEDAMFWCYVFLKLGIFGLSDLGDLILW